MRVEVTFKMVNPDYDQEYADEYNFGKESVDNNKYNWSISWSFDDIHNVKVANGDMEYPYLEVDENPDNVKIAKVPWMCVRELYRDDELIGVIGVSKSLLDRRVVKTAKETRGIPTLVYYFHLKPGIPYFKSGDFLYLTEAEIPAELKRTNHQT